MPGDLRPSIQSFLLCPTPEAWLETATKQLPLLLRDQANCEMKAAASAVSLLHRVNNDAQVVIELSRIAREELKHLELVEKLLLQLAIPTRNLTASRYASELRKWISRKEPQRRVDQLLVCAMIEARSCERISRLIEVLSEPTKSLYEKLHDAEDRHFEFYLESAWNRDADRCRARVASLSELDAELISSLDKDFRFHSGIPSSI